MTPGALPLADRRATGQAGQPRQRSGSGAGGPLVLLYSADLDRSLTAVTSAGGRVVQGPYGFPGGRRFHFLDTSGNELGVWSES